MTAYASVPGVVETRDSFGETTLVVDPARLHEKIRGGVPPAYEIRGVAE